MNNNQFEYEKNTLALCEEKIAEFLTKKLNFEKNIKYEINSHFDLNAQEFKISINYEQWNNKEAQRLGLDFECILNDLRKILDRATFSVIKSSCPTFPEGGVYFPACEDQNKWSKKVKKFQEEGLTDLQILKMFEWVQPYKGFGKSVDRPNENIYILAHKLNNIQKHRYALTLDSSVNSLKFYSKFLKENKNGPTPIPKIKYSKQHASALELLLTFSEKISEIKIDEKLFHPNFDFKIQDDGTFYDTKGVLINMHKYVRYVLHIFENKDVCQF